MLKVAWAPSYAHTLPPKHRFPMEKYALLPEQLLYEGTLAEENFFTPGPMDESLITELHDPEYWEKLKYQTLSRKEIRATGFPLSPELVLREVTIAQGTLEACQYARRFGIAMNVAGGTHHAFSDRGEGFCLLNDQALAAHYLLRENQAQRVLIVDLDVHQGNGTAQIFRDEPKIFTFSMHGAKNYPYRKVSSDLDIGLDDQTPDKVYLDRLYESLPGLIESHRPDFAFYQSGVDILETDKLGRLAISAQGCRERDKFVIETFYKKGIPLVICMGGGYSPRISDIVNAHVETFRIANETLL